MIRYVFKDDWVALKNASKADPQKIGEALAKITADHSGRLTPENVVGAAQQKSHVLHKHFEWDDATAAHHYRLDQARTIIRSIKVVDEETEETQPAFVSVADNGVAYRSVQEVVTSRELQLSVLRQAERDLHAFEKRYSMLQDVCELVKSARSKIEARAADLETRAAA